MHVGGYKRRGGRRGAETGRAHVREHVPRQLRRPVRPAGYRARGQARQDRAHGLPERTGRHTPGLREGLCEPASRLWHAPDHASSAPDRRARERQLGADHLGRGYRPDRREVPGRYRRIRSALHRHQHRLGQLARLSQRHADVPHESGHQPVQGPRCFPVRQESGCDHVRPVGRLCGCLHDVHRVATALHHFRDVPAFQDHRALGNRPRGRQLLQGELALHLQGPREWRKGHRDQPALYRRRRPG